MQESKEEHRIESIAFPIAPTPKANKKEKTQVGAPPLDIMDGAAFSLPSVMVTSSEQLSRERRKNARRRFTVACTMRLLILVFPIACYQQIARFLQEYMPQTIAFSSRIRKDYSAVSGVIDLSTEDIRPWCFNGVTECPCQDPLSPIPGTGQSWKDVHIINQQLTQSAQAIDVDVVFLGDSITEHWRETEMGIRDTKTFGSAEVFRTLFSRAAGSKYNGLALGISGDTSPMLLWRLKHGELPKNLNPRFFWMLIGTNDIGRTWCNMELVVIGVIRNVEEVLKHKPDAQVIINGLLPRSYNRQGFVAKGGPVKPPVWEEIKKINEALEDYAQFRDRVTYFETTSFFTNASLPTAELQIDPALMPDFLHPSPKGYQRWGQEIIHTLDAILEL